jgi:ankyrin repeat protein
MSTEITIDFINDMCFDVIRPIAAYSYDYTNTKIYKYHEKHLELDLLTKNIDKMNNGSSVNVIRYLLTRYSEIMENGLEYILYDIINQPYDIEEQAIFLAAIDKNKIEIMDFLLSKNFDPNQLVDGSQLGFGYSDFLTYATRTNNLFIVKYLVENGADPFKNRMNAFRVSLFHSDIFNFFINLEISYQNLCAAFICVCINVRHNKNKNIYFEIHKKIFDKGINISDIHDVIIKYIGTFPVDLVIFLMDNGLDIGSKNILASAVSVSNFELVDFLLQQGLQMDPGCLKIIFDNMRIEMVKVLIKHNINLSIVKPPKNHYDIATKLETLGMEKDIFIDFLIENFYHPIREFNE